MYTLGVMQCIRCTASFTITQEETDFLQRFSISNPTLCPLCRRQQRYAHRNEICIYADQCDQCGKAIISQYSPDKKLTVYCRACWWSDAWNPFSYGHDFDFSRPFFDQFSELLREVPLMNLLDLKSENSDYTNCASNNKDCYLIFSADYNQQCMYSNWIERSRDVVDCFRLENSEQSYQSFFGEKLYNSHYLIKCFSATDSYYCYDSRNVQDCALSCNLRNKQYYILNKPYSKDEYTKKLAELQLDTAEGRKNALVQFMKNLDELAIHHYRNQLGRVNASTGDYLRNVQHCADCFDLEEAVDCWHVTNMIKVKDAMDCDYGGEGEQGYQNIETMPMPMASMCTYGCYGGNNVYYSHSVMNSKFILGSVAVRKTENVIFNTAYTRKEYETLFGKIRAHMLETGEWGEFFPVEHSLFAYNETNAQHWMPLTPEQVKAKGWRWREPNDNAESSGTAHACVTCGKSFRFVQQEIDFYRQHAIPAPTTCCTCRYTERRAWHNPMQLRLAQCTCVFGAHGHSGRCEIRFKTTYDLKKTTHVYCDDCYTASIY